MHTALDFISCTTKKKKKRKEKKKRLAIKEAKGRECMELDCDSI
jgi:hypothetical protein